MTRKDYTARSSLPFTVGMYLAVNAIRDVRAVIDGPNCLFYKLQFVDGTHDWFSELTDATGRHRIAHTFTDVTNITVDRSDAIEREVRAQKAVPGTKAVLLSSMPVTTITGADYGLLARKLTAETDIPVIDVADRGLQGDWLDGYEAVLTRLAETLPLPATEPTPGAIALVGYLHDRNEWDHRANLNHLRELAKGLGLDIASVWLSGGSLGELSQVTKAATIVALPYGRQAARTLGERLGRPAIELPLPMGLQGTTHWLKEIATACDVPTKKANRVMDEQLGSIVPRLEHVVPTFVADRHFALAGDPHLVRGVAEMLHELGGRAVLQARWALARHEPDPPREEIDLEPTVLVQPGLKTFSEAIRHQQETGRGLDLVIGNSIALDCVGDNLPKMELGYPSFATHALYERPFLGYAGCLRVLAKIAEHIGRAPVIPDHPLGGRVRGE